MKVSVVSVALGAAALRAADTPSIFWFLGTVGLLRNSLNKALDSHAAIRAVRSDSTSACLPAAAAYKAWA